MRPLQNAAPIRIAVGLLLAALWSASAQAATIEIDIAKLKFAPTEVTAHVGDTIVWTNHDFIGHTATARNGAFDLTIDKDKTARTVVKATGVIDYYCRFHPNMTGRITVAP